MLNIYIRYFIMGEHKATMMGLSFILCFSTAIFLLRSLRGQCADIIGGKESAPHSRPFMAALITRNRFCGGTLLKPNWVLTAAHCQLNIETTRVILGVNSLKDTHKQNCSITKMVRHPKFDDKSYANDIMLLKLKEKAKINQSVKTVTLTKPTRDIRAGTQCLVTGWGRTDPSKARSDVLREVNVTVFDRSFCNDERHYDDSVVTTDRLCAGDMKGGKDACQGDSGGPLICNKRQAGIVSIGRRCGDRRYPGIYTRLTKDYLSWIRKTIKQ